MQICAWKKLLALAKATFKQMNASLNGREEAPDPNS